MNFSPAYDDNFSLDLDANQKNIENTDEEIAVVKYMQEVKSSEVVLLQKKKERKK